MKTRIIKRTTYGGDEIFIAQKKQFLFWNNISSFLDWNDRFKEKYNRRSTIESAEEFLEAWLLSNDKKEKYFTESKIKSVEVVRK